MDIASVEAAGSSSGVSIRCKGCWWFVQKVNEKAEMENGKEMKRKVSKLNLSILFLKFLNTYL